MKYLIIGGAGFIGCNFADQLLKRGDEVTVFDNYSRKGAVANVEWLQNRYELKVVKGDIRHDDMSELMEEHDVVFHLAAQVAVTTSVVDPREDFNVNALGTFNVLEAIRLSDRKPIIIYASTNKVYGGMEDIKIKDVGRYEYQDHPLGIREDRLLDFHSPYGCSKGAGDQYVRDYSRIYGLKTVVMRQSCIYGQRQFGVEDQGWVAWFTIASVLNKLITIYGDGKQIRDILHVDDLFTAWDKAVKSIDKAKGKIYNVGGGHENTMSLLELIDKLENLGDKLKLEYTDWRPGDQPVYVSDISKIKNELDWQPTIGVDEGIKQLYKWVFDNKELFV